VERDWDNVQRDIKEWDKHSEHYPWLAFSLGAQYARLKRWDDAERCFKATVKIVPPEVEAWKQLAAVYLQQNKTDRWLATLDEYLKQPDFGLSRHSVQSEVAHHFMNKKEWEKALPYAKGAAECYSAWGLLCAGKCCEGLKQWDEAEKYARACSERYESSGLEWYLFCRRSGHGDLDSARKLAQSSVEKAAKMAVKPDHFNFTTYHLLEKQPEKALTEIEQALGKTPGSIDLLWAAVVADQAKDAKKRDAFLDRIRKPAEKPDAGKANDAVKKAEGPGDGAKPLADLIVDDLAKGGKGRVDIAAADKLFAPLDPWYASWCRFLLGQYLDLRGQTESANTLWKQALSCPQLGGHRTIACSMLLERGIKLEDEKPAAKPDDKKPDDKKTEKPASKHSSSPKQE
jgi:tetratricopeptide (TPR) repeat protein